MKPTILVLMSSYNGENYLEEQIHSLINQKNINLKILIRDDGSTDSTVKIIESFTKCYTDYFLPIEKGCNIGCAESFRWLLNKAFTLIHDYDYFAFCDQDDVWMEEKLFVASNALQNLSKNKPCMYCSNLKVVDEKLNFIGYMRNHHYNFEKGRSLVESVATGCTMLFNKKVLEIFHYYPPQKIRLHDLWVYHMCIFLGEIFYDTNSYILYRQHSNNEIGAKITFYSRLKSKAKSLKILFSQHEREMEAKELLSVYNNILNSEDKKTIYMLANFRQNIKFRCKLLFLKPSLCHSIAMSKKSDNVFLKIRILIGCV